MYEVRCCCEPENLIGFLPKGSPLKLRELANGSFAYDSNHDADAVKQMSGFVEATEEQKQNKTTWKKTWKK